MSVDIKSFGPYGLLLKLFKMLRLKWHKNDAAKMALPTEFPLIAGSLYSGH